MSPEEQLAAHFSHATADPNPMTAKDTLNTYISVYENRFRCLEALGWEKARKKFQTRLGNQLMQMNTQDVSKVVGAYKEFRRPDEALEKVFLGVLRAKIAIMKGKVGWEHLLTDEEVDVLGKSKGVGGLLHDLWKETYELDVSLFESEGE